jgi:hypothetical protein
VAAGAAAGGKVECVGRLGLRRLRRLRFLFLDFRRGHDIDRDRFSRD